MGDAFLMGQSGGVTIKDKAQSYFSTFTSRTHPTSTSWLTGVCYGNGLFIAVGGDKILTSPDTITWTQRNCSLLSLNGVAYGNGMYVACNHSYGRIMTSLD